MVRCEKKTTHVVGRIFVGINAMPIHTLGFFPQVGETPKTPDSPAVGHTETISLYRTLTLSY